MIQPLVQISKQSDMFVIRWYYEIVMLAATSLYLLKKRPTRDPLQSQHAHEFYPIFPDGSQHLNLYQDLNLKSSRGLTWEVEIS